MFISADKYITAVSCSISSYNLFAYCTNNPINKCDHYGNWPQWINNTAKWIAKSIVRPIMHTVQRILSKANLTYSTGLNLSLTPSIWVFNGQIGMSMDTKGNIAIQASGGGGITVGNPGISITKYECITNAPNINKLNDAYYQAGGTVAAPIDDIPIAIGGDLMLIPDLELNTQYLGFTKNVGIGSPGSEFHFEWGVTLTLPNTKMNVFQVAQSVLSGIMEW